VVEGMDKNVVRVDRTVDEPHSVDPAELLEESLENPNDDLAADPTAVGSAHISEGMDESTLPAEDRRGALFVAADQSVGNRSGKPGDVVLRPGGCGAMECFERAPLSSEEVDVFQSGQDLDNDELTETYDPAASIDERGVSLCKLPFEYVGATAEVQAGASVDRHPWRDGAPRTSEEVLCAAVGADDDELGPRSFHRASAALAEKDFHRVVASLPSASEHKLAMSL